MKIYKITEASEYLGVSINTLKTLANNGKITEMVAIEGTYESGGYCRSTQRTSEWT